MCVCGGGGLNNASVSPEVKDSRESLPELSLSALLLCVNNMALKALPCDMGQLWHMRTGGCGVGETGMKLIWVEVCTKEPCRRPTG